MPAGSGGSRDAHPLGKATWPANEETKMRAPPEAHGGPRAACFQRRPPRGETELALGRAGAKALCRLRIRRCLCTMSYADARLVHSIKMPKITFLVNKRISPSFSSNCRAHRARDPFFLTSHHPLGVLRVLVCSGRAGTGRLTNTRLVLTVLEAEDTGVWWGSPHRPGSEGAGSTLLPGHSSNVWGLQPVTQSPPKSPTS